METKENKLISELKKQLNSPWLFYSLENAKESVKIDKELILAEELDFINIIAEFYTVEALHKNVGGNLKESIDNEKLREVFDYYGDLLRLKLFYQNELSNILESIVENDDDLYKYYYDYWYDYILFDAQLEDLFAFYKFLKADEEVFLIDLLQLKVLNCIFLKILFGSSDSNIDIRYLLESDLWNELIRSRKVLSQLDRDKRKIESALFYLNTGDLDRIGRVLDISKMAEQYFKEIGELKLDNFENNKIKCYASVRKNNIIYMTLNGVKDYDIKVNGANGSNLQKVVNILAKLLGGNVEYVSISPDTRYYVNPDLYINFSQFENSNENLNRMFTCCERKLIAKMFTLDFGNDGEIELLVTKCPCQICSRTIDFMNRKEDAKLEVKIIDPLREEFSLNEQDIEKMDECAKKIDKQYPR